MTLDLTDLTRVKLLLSSSLTVKDALISQQITMVSKAAESLMGRHAEEVSRTELFTTEVRDRAIGVRGFGGGLAVAAVHNSNDRVYDSGTLVAATDYAVDSRTGVITFDRFLEAGALSTQIEYTGGLGTDLANVLVNGYDDIVGAVSHQVVFMVKRAAAPEVTAASDPSGNVSLVSPLVWIPWVRKTLLGYRVQTIY